MLRIKNCFLNKCLFQAQPNHKVKGHRLDVKKALSKSEMAAVGPGGGSGGGGGRRGGGRGGGGGGGGWGNRQNQDWGNSGKR